VNNQAIIFVIFNVIAILFLPRRWAASPLLIGACYMTLGQGLNIGPFTFTVIRIIVAAGVLRILIKRERFEGPLLGIDKIMVAWAIWAILSSYFHSSDNVNPLVFRLGLVYNICGVYFLLRIFCISEKDIINLIKMIAFLLAPIAIEMLVEKTQQHNLFSFFGGVPESPDIRKGSIRAQGPFAHAILAGTVGATCLPLMFGIWRKNPIVAKVGCASCIIMIIACASSGPILSSMTALGALCMWKYHGKMYIVRRAAVSAYLFLLIIMEAPPYFLMARIDLAGGSTGWHRAELIRSSLEHLPEWWLAGTDFTRHWMPTGVSWNPDHTDITNYYLQMGVWGGLPLMFLFIWILIKGFSYISVTMKSNTNHHPEDSFLAWSIGSSLFAHAATSISVSYFDQSFLFIYLILAGISTLLSVKEKLKKDNAQKAHGNEIYGRTFSN